MSLKVSAERLVPYEGVAALLPEGPHGCAFTVRHKASQRLCTLRVLQWENLNTGSEELDRTLKRHVLAEVELQATENHKHMTTFMECFAAKGVGEALFAHSTSKMCPHALCMCIVTANEDLTLQRVIEINRDKGEKIAEERIWKWMHQAVVALGHLHANGIVHRDIRPSTIFVDSDDNLKLSDGGVAALLTRQPLIDKNDVASVAYLSPEGVQDGSVDAKSDMWALGCVIHELITLSHPFCLKEDLVLYDIQNIAPPKILKKEHDYSWYLRILPRWLLQKDAKFRPSALDVFSHVVCNWKEYSKDQEGRPWVDEKLVPWTEAQLEDEEARLMLRFDAERSIQTTECVATTWEELLPRNAIEASVTKAQAASDISDEMLAPVSRQGAALIST